MATLWNIDFAAANGTKWTSAGFDKVLGTTSVVGLVATISANKGIGPATANESIYRASAFAAQRDHKVRVAMKWNNAAGSGRAAGPGVRISSDGKTGYFAILDSNFGACRIKLVRRRNNVFTSLGGGWTITNEGAADLNAGVTVMLRVQTQDDGVHLKVSIGSNVYFDVVDPSVAGVSIEDGGTGGIYHDNTVVTTDITFDDLECLDFEDEATSGTGWQTGIGLTINGTYYSEDEWRAAGLSPEVARVSYAPVPVGTISDLNDPGSPFLRVGDWVQFLYDGTVLAEGMLQTARQSWPPPGGIVYDLVGPRQLAEETLIEDPDTGAPFVSFNFDADSEFYNADRADMTVGDVLKWIYDNLVAGDAGLRGVKAAPASGDCYVAGDLTGLDAKIPSLTISGNVLQAEETLLSFMPEYAIFVDPTTRVRRVHKRSTAAITDIKASEGHRTVELTRDTSKNYTRIVVFGTVPDAEDETFLFDPNDPNSSLTPYWDRSLEDKWAPDKAKTLKNSFTIIGFGTESALDPDNPNYIYIVVDSGVTKMDQHEWAATMVVISSGPAAGTYTVRDNTQGGKIWLKAFTFTGGNPNIGDPGFLTGVDDPAYKRNGHDAAFKEFDLNGAAMKGPCATALVKNRQGTKTKTIKVKAKRFKIDNGDGTTRDGVRLDLPAIGLINRLGTLCDEDNSGGAVPADEVEVTVPTYDPTTQPIPKVVVPDPGFRGTAYSFDSTRWNGGGEPAAGDPACKRTLPLNFPDFQNVALQGAEYTKMADSMLAVLGTLAISGTIGLNEGIVTSWGGLNKRVTWTDDGDDGADPKATGYETVDLWLLQTEFNLRDETTTLFIGTLSSTGVDLDAYRKRYAEKTRLDQLRRMRKLAQELRDCLKDAFNGAGAASDDGGQTQSGCNVSSDQPGTSMTERVKNFWDLWLIFLDWLDDLLWIQKGIWITDANGNLLSETELHDLLNNAAVNGFGGVEGAIQAAIMGSLAYQKGWSFSGFVWNGGTAIPTFTDGGGNVFRLNPDGSITMNGQAYGPVIGGLEGSMLSNLGKTIDNATGLVVSPGTVLGSGGGTYYGPGGRVSLPAGSTAPGSLSSKVAADNAAAFGFTMTNGLVTDALGQTWRPMANGTWVNVGSGATGFPAFGGGLGLALGNLGKSVSATTGVELAPGSTTPAGGGYHYGPGGSVTPLSPGDTVPGNAHTEAKAVEKAATGLVTPSGTHNVTAPAHHGASVYVPVAGQGFQKVSGAGLASPSFGGMMGATAGKCGSTFDGAAMPGSGPGALLKPGDTVGADGAYYYPPTEHAGDPDVIQLAPGDVAPCSSVTLYLSILDALGLSVVTLSDEGGMVFTDGSTLYRPEPATSRLRVVTNTPGTGLNGGDYSWGGATYFSAGGGASMPTGAVIMYAAPGGAPTGYLLCDGTNYSAVAQPTLFAAIGTLYGASGGPGTFDVPNFKDRFPQGANPGTDPLSTTGGSKTPAITDPGHAHGGATMVGATGITGTVANTVNRGVAGAVNTVAAQAVAIVDPGHLHVIPPMTTGVSLADGRPPFLAVDFVIKA